MYNNIKINDHFCDLAEDPEVPGSIPGARRFSVK
jgi:hypothetical protein